MSGGRRADEPSRCPSDDPSADGRLYEELYQEAPCGDLSLDMRGLIVRANRTMGRWLELRGEDTPEGTAFCDLLSNNSAAAWGTQWMPMLRMQGALADAGLELLRPDGSSWPVVASAVLNRDVAGAPVEVRILLFDARDRAGYERALLESRQLLRISERRHRIAFDGAPIGMAIVDLAAEPPVFLQVNAALGLLLGRDPAELVGIPASPVLDLEASPSEAEGALAGAHQPHLAAHRLERTFVRPDGGVTWALLTSSVLRDDATAGRLLVVQLEDVTARKEAERRLHHLAFHDPLTGLANRALLMEHLEHALARAPRIGARVAVLFIDLDDFKHINDSFGHAAGDRLLATVAARLNGALRESDVVGRLGGDEFAVICEDLDDDRDAAADAAAAVADRIDEALTVDVPVDGVAVRLSISIGIAVSGTEGTADDLLRDADAAMYRAKRGGGARHEHAQAADHEHAVRRMELETSLRQALKGPPGQLQLHYQPAVDLVTGRIVAVEALLRWEHPLLGLLGPGEFLDVAEGRQLMEPLGRWVLTEACREAARWGRFGHQAPQVWVNVSARQLGHQRMVTAVGSALAATGLDPARLCLEITERQLVAADGWAEEDLLALPELGVLLSIDDFGTGYAGLEYLRRVPFDILKIDRSYVEAIGTDRTHTAIGHGIVSIGRALGLTIVAEGVSTEDHRRRVTDLGCHLGQGFLFHRPVPAAALETLLRRAPGSPPTRPMPEPAS